MHCVVNYTGYLSLIGAIKSTLRNYIIEHVLKKKKYNQFSEVNDQEKSRGTATYYSPQYNLRSYINYVASGSVLFVI